MPPRKAAAKNSKMSRANASDQESKTKNRVSKRSSKVEIENMVEELPPKKKAKAVHNHKKQGEWQDPSNLGRLRGVLAAACQSSIPEWWCMCLENATVLDLI